MAVLTGAGVGGCEAHVLFAATEDVDTAVLRDKRGWSAAEWAAATDRIRERGLVKPSTERATSAGRALRDHVEQRTDELALQLYRALSDEEVRRLLELAAAVARPIVTSETIPFPNPMGLPRPG